MGEEEQPLDFPSGDSPNFDPRNSPAYLEYLEKIEKRRQDYPEAKSEVFDVHYSGAAFHLSNFFTNTTRRMPGYGCVYIYGGVSDFLVLPLTIPEGFRITSFEFLLKDTDPSLDIDIYIYRQYPFSGESDLILRMDHYDDVGGGFIYSWGFIDHTVDYKAGNYEVWVRLKTGDSKHQICQAEIRFERDLPSIFPIALPLINK